MAKPLNHPLPLCLSGGNDRECITGLHSGVFGWGGGGVVYAISAVVEEMSIIIIKLTKV
jgi:hypothetical protein